MTLVEVALGLAILATLLATVLVARARHVEQLATAQRKLAAVRAADALLAEWFTADVDKFPRDSSGKFAGDGALAWHTRVVPNASLADDAYEAEVVRVDVLDDRAVSREDAAPLASVEVVLPRPKPGEAGR
jgi:hypothetical protein